MERSITSIRAFTYAHEFHISTEAINTSAVRYGYEADSLVTCASMTSCSPAGSDALRITWDPLAARVSGVTLGGTSETRTYNAYGELATIRVTHGSTLLYAETLDAPTEERDALGRIVTRTETTPSGTTQWKYAYDPRGRLTLVLRDDELYERLAYDANGNRIRRETPDEMIEATYDAQDRLLTYGPYEYTYTAHGELRTKTDTRDGTVTTYTYDARGNLVRVDLPDATVIEYVIDGLDRRVAKKKNGVMQKRWLYRDQLRIAAELDGNGNLASRFVYASRSNVPDFVVRGGVTYRVISDHLGSPRVVVHGNDPSQVAHLMRHDSWGTVLDDSSPGWMPFGFAGGLYDPDTALVRFGARDYDPYTGRWTARDPIHFRGGSSNLYQYVRGDPINHVDPSGLADVFVGIEGDLVGIVGGEAGFGFVLDTDNLMDSGFFTTGGPAAGANVGLSLCFGGVARDIEGYGGDFDVNAGPVSPSILFDSQGINGGQLGFGPGIGASIAQGHTSTTTIRDILGWFQ